jgi:hypothetical protein
MPHPLQSTITNLVLMGVNRRAAELVVLQEGLTDIEDALDFLGTYPSGRRPPRAKRSARKPRMLHAEQAAAVAAAKSKAAAAAKSAKKSAKKQAARMKRPAPKKTTAAKSAPAKRQRTGKASSSSSSSASASSSVASAVSKPAAKDPNRPKRGKSAFLFFSAERRPAIVKQNKDASFAEIGRLIGSEWRFCKDRSKYNRLATKDKARYAAEMAKYGGGTKTPVTSKKTKAPTKTKKQKNTPTTKKTAAIASSPSAAPVVAAASAAKKPAATNKKPAAKPGAPAAAASAPKRPATTKVSKAKQDMLANLDTFEQSHSKARFTQLLKILSSVIDSSA